jgi:sugar O-acyltransferase (sialic acid O-acetyltransferase NeuD family)
MAKIVIFGVSEFGLLCHFYLTHDSPHEVVAFTVDHNFIREKTVCGLPVVPFENIESSYPPDHFKMLVAVQFNQVNKTRAAKYFQAKEKGFELISYVSSKASTWPGLVIGDNCIISESSVIHPFAVIGDNVIIAGSVIGHHSIIKNHCFLAAQAVVLGGTSIGPYCFLGANSTILHGLDIAQECIIGAGVTISKNTREKGVYVNQPPELLSKSSTDLSAWLSWPK